MINRYTLIFDQQGGSCAWMGDAAEGEYVKFEDHVREVTSAEVVSEVLANEKLRAEIDLWRSAFGQGDPLTVRGGWQRKFMEMESKLKAWTDVFSHLGSTPDECGNAIIAKYDQYEVQLIEMEARIDHLASQLKEDSE